MVYFNPAPGGGVAASSGPYKSVKDFGAKGDGVTDDSVAIASGIQWCMDSARDRRQLSTTTFYACTGLPTLYFPPGVYVNRRTHNLRFLYGFRIIGAGKQVSVIQHQTANACFYLNRSREIIFSHLTLESFDPAVATAIKGLVQNSVAFQIAERREDNLDGSLAAAGTTGNAQANGAGSTLRITFEHVEVNRFHRAYRLEGNQQLDDIKWYSPRHADNFFDWQYLNSQAVNQQLYGGEVLYGYGATATDYQNRVNTWTTPPDWRDGAIWDVTAGGQIGVFGMSMIPTKTVVLMTELNADQANPASTNFVGTNVAAMPISFYNCRWEMRRNDANTVAVQGVSIHRCTLFRPSVVAPDTAFRSRMKLGFFNCNMIFNSSGEFTTGGVMNVFHLRNWVGVYMANCTYENAGVARIRHCSSAPTETNSGYYFTVCTTNITEDVVYVTGYAPTATVKHRVHKEATEWAAANTQAL